ncbi:hypothetical protein E1295_12850 [Nonomuraea mesophila]|uniref:Uncharacterized protein n=1 Tax=Nonomuraea mesophila TaxID=2530382 RepID=A0A4R5FSM0_9ACTN|nr:hypothetical protein E1295_12850 [Nonomuraea mesophila]
MVPPRAVRASLSGASLSGLSLSRASLSGVSLFRVSLSGGGLADATAMIPDLWAISRGCSHMCPDKGR